MPTQAWSLHPTLALAMALTAAGCQPQPEPPPCDDLACAEVCEEHAVDDASGQLEARALSGVEVSYLSDRLLAFRRGPRPVASPRGFTLCRGTTRCEEPRAGGGELPDGVWVVHAELDVPADGRWTIVYERTCTVQDDGRSAPEVETRSFELTSRRPGEPVILEAIEAFRAPAAEPTACEVTLRPEQGRSLAVLSFELPARP